MGKYTIQEIAKILVEKNKLTQKEANQFVAAMFEIIQERLHSDGVVKVKGLGTFKLIQVDARESVSVRTGERVVIESHAKVSFTPDATMKELVNKPFSQFETVVLNDGVEFEDLKDDLTEEELQAEDALDTAPSEILIASSEAVVEPAVLTVEPSAPVEPVEPEPAIESVAIQTEKVFEASSVAQPLMEVVETNELPTGPVSEEVEETAELYDEEEATGSWLKYVGGGLLVLALMAVSAYGGYWYRGYEMSQITSVADSVVMSKDSVAVDSLQTEEDVDSVGTVASAAAVEATEEPAVETKPAAKEEPKVAAEVAFDSKKYEAMDARVRTGAYRIVGTDHEVKVRKGETLARICRRELGDGMSCYVEVYNGLSADAELKEGQIIKIPKLQWKVKRKQ